MTRRLLCMQCERPLPCACGLNYHVGDGTPEARARELGRPFEAFTRVLPEVNRRIVERQAQIDLERRIAERKPRA